jgi:hypothetical protein
MDQNVNDALFRSTRWTSQSSKSIHKQDSTSKSGTSSKTSSAKDGTEIRQMCIKTLRRFAQRGILSPQQKRLLISDIIYSSASGELSTVEVAYDLLFAETETRTASANDHVDVEEEREIAEEEFAEQCRVFAASLARSSSSDDYESN